MNRQRLANPFMWSVVGAGAAACLYSAYHLPLAGLDLLFLLLAAATVITSHITVPLPGVNGRITVSETFIFLTILLYGGEAAVLLAAIDGFCSSRLISRKVITLSYNAAQLAVSTFVTVLVLRFFFGDVVNLAHGDFSVNFLAEMTATDAPAK